MTCFRVKDGGANCLEVMAPVPEWCLSCHKHLEFPSNGDRCEDCGWLDVRGHADGCSKAKTG